MNINTWSIRIGKHKVSFRQVDGVIDTVCVRRKWFMMGDTIFADYYQCGGTAYNATTQILIRNDSDQILNGDKNSTNKLCYTAWIPISDILSNWQLNQILTLSVSLRIRHRDDEIGGLFRIGVLKLN